MKQQLAKIQNNTLFENQETLTTVKEFKVKSEILQARVTQSNDLIKELQEEISVINTQKNEKENELIYAQSNNDQIKNTIKTIYYSSKGAKTR